MKFVIVGVGFLILGILLRLYFLLHAIDNLVFDSMTYAKLAEKIQFFPFFVDCCDKNSGYPLFLLINKLLFGENYLICIKIIQIILDLLTAFIVYLTAKEIFGRKVAIYSFAIYLLNPFVASFSVMVLPETLTLFLVAAATYIISQSLFKGSKLLWLIWGITLGLIVFLRLSLFYLSILMAILFFILLFKRFNKVYFLIFAFLGFTIASSYTLIGNFKRFGVINYITPYNASTINLYLNFFNSKRFPELLSEYPLDPNYLSVVNEFYYNYDSGWMPMQVANMREKYTALFWKRFQSDWPFFLAITIQNMLFMWDKKHLFTYTDPFYPDDKIPLRIINLFLIILFFIAIQYYLFKDMRKSIKNPLFIFTAAFFLYITFFYSLVTNETRHSIIFYGLLSLWAGYGISIVFDILKDIKLKKVIV